MTRFEVFGLPGMPELRAGDDLIDIVWAASTATPLVDGDIVVITSKIVSKVEGRVLVGVDRDDAIDAELVRTVSEWTTPRGRARIVETRHGLVMAAAGVDASNVEPGSVVLLPVDPDASARRLRDGLRDRHGVRVGVVVTDTAGRPWREGLVDIAIGASGVRAVDDLRGRRDPYGNELDVTAVAVADELAAATELVRGKLAAMPVAIVRGLAHLLLPPDAPDDGAATLVRPAAADRFRLGTPEAMRTAVNARRTARRFTGEPVDAEAVRGAVAAALAAPMFSGTVPWRLELVESPDGRARFVEKLTDDALATAALLIVPCAIDRSEATLLSLGAAVQNLLVTFGTYDLASAWLPPGPHAVAAAATLDLSPDWIPMGVIAIGRSHIAR